MYVLSTDASRPVRGAVPVPSVRDMFDRTGGRATAPSESARRRLELLSNSLASELPRSAEGDGVTAAEPDDDRPRSSPEVGPGRHAARPLPRSTRVAAGLSDHVPVPVRAAWSTNLSGHHLAVVSLLLAIALCVAGWWALTAKPEVQAAPQLTPVPSATPPEATASPSAPASPSTPSGQAPQASEAPPAAAGDVVIVDVAGRVRRPGIVTLPLGSRVADALDAAGGPRGDVDLASLNLARVLLDGEQVLVGVEPVVPPVVPDPPPEGSTSQPGVLVNLNSATEADLDTLPGVGPVTAQAILDWRTEHGGFTSVDELLEVSGIGEVTMEELRPLVTV
uniref:Late competence protein ComEA, DNA receptor n=1 Tax=uncultured Nocardioidaceae bacterium TaxID=253824 RepID=A0A6J4MSL6_9ACTN|nr:MAG: Late competence protein ComEA, DNA receptor [uncultured Nocardioidaceae bacterium]